MPAGSYRFEVGDIGCVVLSDGYFSYPARWVFPNAEPEELTRALQKRNLPRERILSPYTCLLIQTGRHVILVDTGAGETSSTTGAVRARLEMEGVRPDDVDTVVLTHAHPDHIGGAVDPRGRPVFRNARHIIADAEWEHWTQRATTLSMRVPSEMQSNLPKVANRCLAALRFQVETVSGEFDLAPGVTVFPAPGHTPGHMGIFLHSGQERLLAIGDAAVHPLHLEHPTWENGFDLQPDVALVTRRELAERAAKERLRLMAFHFPFPSVGRVGPLTDGGWEWFPGW
jgi:glyoxylase-like metal-dependent hydrolase (beta-lactamase superfamily II)